MFLVGVDLQLAVSTDYHLISRLAYFQLNPNFLYKKAQTFNTTSTVKMIKHPSKSTTHRSMQYAAILCCIDVTSTIAIHWLDNLFCDFGYQLTSLSHLPIASRRLHLARPKGAPRCCFEIWDPPKTKATQNGYQSLTRYITKTSHTVVQSGGTPNPQLIRHFIGPTILPNYGSFSNARKSGIVAAIENRTPTKSAKSAWSLRRYETAAGYGFRHAELNETINNLGDPVAIWHGLIS